MLPVMNRSWFPTMFDDFFDGEWTPKVSATAPAVNVKEDAKEYTMEVAAPGIKKEYCRININNDGNLEVAIENKLEHREENKKEHYLRREFSYSNYQQTYILPDNVDKDKISAKVNDGVLEIKLPKFTKEEESRAQRAIEIK